MLAGKSMNDWTVALVNIPSTLSKVRATCLPIVDCTLQSRPRANSTNFPLRGIYFPAV